jgi:hypothetical protein
MILEDVTEFSATLKPMRPIIGLDLGTVTIGLAVSDTFLGVASPLDFRATWMDQKGRGANPPVPLRATLKSYGQAR